MPSAAPATAQPTTAQASQAAVSTAALIAASTPVGSTSNGAAKVPLPAYIPFNGPKPDLPGTADGIDPGYFSYPKNTVRTVQEPVGTGEFSAIVKTTAGLPTPVDQNPAWQEVNKRLGMTSNLNIVATADYATRLPALIAGGDLPDMVYNAAAFVSHAPDLLAAQFADLTPYLSGDAIKDYPNLASFPTVSWTTTVFNGALYAVPVPRAIFYNAMSIHSELFSSFPAPNNGDDLKKVLQGLTKPQANQWGIVSYAGSAFGLGIGQDIYGFYMAEMFRAPNNWKLDSSGKLVKDYETDEFKAAVGYVRDLYAAGVYDPNSLSNSTSQADTAFRSGTSASWPTGWGAWTQDWSLALGPNTKLGVLPPIGADGGSGSAYLSAGQFGMTFIKKNSPDRIKMMLRVLNFLAAPFGSEEYLLLNYGVEGPDFAFDAAGNPTLTAKGASDTLVPWKYLTAAAPVLYYGPNAHEFATTAQAAQKAMLQVGVRDPTLPLYSQTQATNGALIRTAFLAGVTDIVAGRRPLTDLDQLAADWRTGGDTIRAEYEQALASGS
jgi:putative aldouronate transport system substrate-binding protein